LEWQTHPNRNAEGARGGRVRVRATSLEAHRQADPAGHGGVHGAVMVDRSDSVSPLGG